MDLKCDHCGRRFNTNTRLYMHKQNSHRTPSILLVKHNKQRSHSIPSGFKRKRNKSDGDSSRNKRKHSHPIPSGFKRKREESDDDSHKNKRKHIVDDELDDGLQVIDEVVDDDEHDDGLKIIDEVDDDDEHDDGLKIIDEIDDDDEHDDGLKIIDEIDDDDEHEDGLKIVDEVDDDDEHDEGLEIKDQYDDDNNPGDRRFRPKINVSTRKPNYKVLYQNCIKKYRRLKLKCEKLLNDLNNKRKQELKQKLEEVRKKYNQDITWLKRTHERKMDDLEQLKDITCDDKIRNIERKHQSEIGNLNAQHDAKINDLEEECEAKIKALNDHIKDLQKDDDEDFSTLSKAIFNCTTMEEIFEIQRLIKNHQIDVVVQKHLKTLQNLFLSLSYGIIPICDPQRRRISNSQRQLVEQIQNSSSPTAKRHIKEKRNEVINLFTIINDSLKLVRNSFNRYASLGV